MDDLVVLRRHARGAAEQFGLSPRSVRLFSTAALEAGTILLAESGDATAEIALSASAELQLSITIAARRDTIALREALATVRQTVDRFSLREADGYLVVTLAAALPSDPSSAKSALLPATEEIGPIESTAGDDSGEENVRLRQALLEVQSELSETNRAVVALHAEAEHHAERLRQAEDRLRVLVESVHDYAICLLDLDGRITSWNPGAERIFGYSSEEIIGRDFACFYQPADREADLPAEHLRRAIADGRVECERVNLRRGGASFEAFILLTPMRGRDAAVRGLSLVVRDVSERRRLEDSLRRRADELAAANRAKEDFLATLSHELRTPLNAMLGWTRLARMGKLNPTAMARALETIERNAHVQEQLIADILDVSRIVTGKLRVDLRPLELEPIVDASIDALRPAAAAKGVQFSGTLCSAGTILGDPDRLQQVVWNLLSNAIKFTPAGGRVSIALSRAGANAVITVTDTGEGMPPSLLPFVFDRFTQGDASVTRPHGGLGLGLSIVRHIMELHGGQARAHSDGPGRGATFTLTFPIRAVQSEAVTTAPKPVAFRRAVNPPGRQPAQSRANDS